MTNKITDITEQVKNKGRFSVFINGEFSFGISDFDLLRLSLKIGQEISDEYLQEIILSLNESKCLDYASSLVSSKLYTEKSIRDKLKGKGYSALSITNAVNKLKEYKYIDDYFYAETYIDETKHKFGTFKIRQKLFEKGVPSSIIDECMLDFENSDYALNVLKAKLRGNAPIKEDIPKLLRFLAQKGFSYDESKKAIDACMEEFDVE